MVLCLFVYGDYELWVGLCVVSCDFLILWELVWVVDYLLKKSFINCVYWVQWVYCNGMVLFLFLLLCDGMLVGVIMLDNIWCGLVQMVSIGYWIGQFFVWQGYMCEVIDGLVKYVFIVLDLLWIEVVCLLENVVLCGVLECVGFKYEGVV